MRDVKSFVLSRISEDAILGMSFLTYHDCSMDFEQPMLQVDEQELTGTDRHGKLLLSNEQVVREVGFPTRTEMNVQRRVTTKNHNHVVLIESQSGVLPVATSLNQPRSNGQAVARILKFTEQLIQLGAGSTIGTFTRVEENRIDNRLLEADNGEVRTTCTSVKGEEVPEYLQK